MVNIIINKCDVERFTEDVDEVSSDVNIGTCVVGQRRIMARREPVLTF